MFKVVMFFILLTVVVIGLIADGSDDGIDDYMYYNGHRYYRKK